MASSNEKKNITQIHQLVFTNDICQVNGWETLLLKLLSVFFKEKGLAGFSHDKEKEDYNPLDYFCMRIIED